MFLPPRILPILAAAACALALPLVELESSYDHSNIDLTRYSKVGFVYPKPRGWVNETDQEAPCGGLPVNDRTEWPLTGGQFSLLLADKAYSVQLSFSNSSNPTSDADFQPLMQSFTGGDQIGHTCFNTPDFSSLGITAGQDVTVQIEYFGDGTDMSPYYQCADLRVVETANYQPANYTCVNSLASLDDVLSGDAFGTSADDGGLSLAAAGGIGAGVTLGVIGLLLGALFALGLLSFGRKKKSGTNVNAPATRQDDESSRGSGNGHHKY